VDRRPLFLVPLIPDYVVRPPPCILDAPKTDPGLTSDHQPFVSAHSEDAAPNPGCVERSGKWVERTAQREALYGGRFVPPDQCPH
jgi:hypothetical protein